MFRMLFQMNLPELGYIILGCFAALINGSVEPLFAISISDYIGAFSKYEYGSEELEKEILAWSMLCKLSPSNFLNSPKLRNNRI